MNKNSVPWTRIQLWTDSWHERIIGINKKSYLEQKMNHERILLHERSHTLNKKNMNGLLKKPMNGTFVMNGLLVWTKNLILNKTSFLSLLLCNCSIVINLKIGSITLLLFPWFFIVPILVSANCWFRYISGTVTALQIVVSPKKSLPWLVHLSFFLLLIPIKIKINEYNLHLHLVGKIAKATDSSENGCWYKTFFGFKK